MSHKFIPKQFQKFQHPHFLKDFDFNSFSKIALTKYNGGGVVEALEEKWRGFINSSHVLSFNSGTSALHTIYKSLGLGYGDEVVVSNYTFFACATPLVALGCKIVFVDCDQYGNIDPLKLREHVSHNTKALVITHLWGQPCDMEAILSICNEFKIALVEDCSHAHGALYKGKRVGTFGIASAWSVGAKKNITGGHGGLLSTNDDNIMEKSILFSHYNESRFFDWMRNTTEDIKTTGTGLNLRMHQFSASLLLDQIDTIDEIIYQKEESVDVFSDYIKGLNGVTIALNNADKQHAYYSLPIRLKHDMLGPNFRERLLLELFNMGAIDFDKPVTTGPLHQYSIFRALSNHNALSSSLSYHNEVIKVSPWYAENRLEYAKWYGEAFFKAYEKTRKYLL